MQVLKNNSMLYLKLVVYILISPIMHLYYFTHKSKLKYAFLIFSHLADAFIQSDLQIRIIMNN